MSMNALEETKKAEVETASGSASTPETAAVKTEPSAAPMSAPAQSPEPVTDWENDKPKEKPIDKTWGGKIMHAIIYWGFGFVGNSLLSMGITYYLNPKPSTKRVKDFFVNAFCKMRGIKEDEIKGLSDKINTWGGMTKVEREAAGDSFFLPQEKRGKNILLNVRSAIEIVFMLISGFVMLCIMAPLSKHQDKLAYKINQMLGKDTEIVPDSLKPQKEPETPEERIQMEFDKRVNRKINFTDMMLTRIPTFFAVILGDNLLNRFNLSRESKGKESLYTAGWRTGLAIERKAPKEGWIRNRLNGMVEFWKNRGSSIDDMKSHMMEHYERLEASALKHNANHPNGPLNETSLVMADQARLLGKEWGWTFIMATSIERISKKFRNWRVKREQANALEEMKAEGIIPQGYETTVKKDGTLDIKAPDAPAAKSFAAGMEPRKDAAKPQKRSFIDMSERSTGQEVAVGA